MACELYYLNKIWALNRELFEIGHVNMHKIQYLESFDINYFICKKCENFQKYCEEKYKMFWDIQEAIYFSTQNLQNINYLTYMC